MLKATWTTFGILAMLAATSRDTHASVIAKTDPHDTIASAQDITPYFTLDYDENIGDINGVNTSTTISHVTIEAVGDDTYDYFKFDVAEDNSLGIFDIDFGSNSGIYIDTELGLFKLDGTALVENDDFDSNAGALGSDQNYDAFIQHTFATAGTYVIGVAQYTASAEDGGFSGNTPAVGSTYTLQVSVENVPEPSSLLLAIPGLIGLAGCRRRKRAA